MSRSSDFVFIPVDPVALEAQLTSAYESLTGMSVQPASPEKLFIQWVTAIIVQERAQANYAANQCIPSRADGENLDALAELFFVTSRPEAQHARCTERFTISEAQETAILVPAGTRVTDASQTLVWETEEDAIIPIGSTYVDAAVVCQTAGTSGNGWSVGQLSTIVDVFDYYASCANTTESDGGTDEMSDDDFYALMQSSLDAYSTAGAVGAYEYYAKAVSSEIASVVVTSPSACEVEIYALMDDGTPATTEIKNAILEACSDSAVRPLTDHVQVEDPEAVEYSITMRYWLGKDDAASAATIQAAVNAAVDEYVEWQGKALGRSINPSVLIGKVMAAGAKRVEVTSPVYTKLDETPTPQYAMLEDQTVTFGGYEDG